MAAAQPPCRLGWRTNLETHHRSIFVRARVRDGTKQAHSPIRSRFGRHCGVRIDVNPRSARDFHTSAKIARISTLGLVEGSTSPVRQENARGLMVNDDITFVGVTTSRWGASQLGRGLDLQPGDWSPLSNSDVSEITIPEACRFLAFSVPRTAMKSLVPDIDATFARRLPASSPALQMLVRISISPAATMS
ncbi:hypothetical protein H8A99_14120 [Bradyrhizobium sp. Arg68]|uniref:AraC-like ligand-binding domain-containing protein n=1 Tax=Bradyrhizobium ivorense TaxID=2511166 RepID=UPI001E39FFFC|nr:hypothetical protein [Bradyrhizobium ivorense]MCC8937574.1 hypothetical protein [Bradyrhizobium ivorense]